MSTARSSSPRKLRLRFVHLFFLAIGLAIGLSVPREWIEKASQTQPVEAARETLREAGKSVGHAADKGVDRARETARATSSRVAQTAQETREKVEDLLAASASDATTSKSEAREDAAAATSPTALERGMGAHVQEIHGNHCLHGCPSGVPETNGLIIRDIYLLSSNDNTKMADWVAYRLTPEMLEGGSGTERYWVADPWLDPSETLEPEDYRGANAALKVDRGHQAPLANFKGTKQWADTNFLSNITPQKSELNQGPWRILEEAERDLAREFGEIWVMTGPLYEKATPDLPGADEDHKIPSDYWKIIAVRQEPKPESVRVAAFVMGQETGRNARFLDFSVTVEEVQSRTGLDFFRDLPDSIEQKLEQGDDREWLENKLKGK